MPETPELITFTESADQNLKMIDILNTEFQKRFHRVCSISVGINTTEKNRAAIRVSLPPYQNQDTLENYPLTLDPIVVPLHIGVTASSILEHLDSSMRDLEERER